MPEERGEKKNMLHIREKKKSNFKKRTKEREERKSDNSIYQMLIICFSEMEGREIVRERNRRDREK